MRSYTISGIAPALSYGKVPSKEEDIKPARKYTPIISLKARSGGYLTTQTPCGACYVHAQRTFSILLRSSVRTGTQAKKICDVQMCMDK
jgi:hypothetical protein